MTGFLNIHKIILPIGTLEEVYIHLRKAGRKGVEGVALFAGTSKGSVFKVKTAIIPKQQAFNHEGGLLYTVDGDELHRINVWLYRNKLSLIAQIHSHPNEAYHSETDDKYPIVTIVGGISVVIPDFGFNPISISDWAVYRLHHNQRWVNQNLEQAYSLISIV